MSTIKKTITIYTQYYKPVVNACSHRAEKMVLALKDDYEVQVVSGMPNYPNGIKQKKYRWKLFKKETGEYGEKIFRTYEFASKNEGSFLRILNYVSFLLSSFIFGAFSSKPSMIIVTSPPLFTAISVLWIHKLRKIPYIIDIRDLWPESVVALGYMKQNSISYKVFHFFELKIYKNAEKIIGVTKGITKFIGELGFPSKKIILQYNTSEKIHIVNEANPYEQFNDAIKGRRISLFAGNMNEAYDFDTVARVVVERKDIYFVFIGDGSQKSNLEKRVVGLDNVLFIDRMEKSEINRYIYYCDIILVPLKDESFYKGTFPVKGIEGIVNKKEILFFGPKQGEFNIFLRESQKGNIDISILEFEGFKKNLLYAVKGGKK